MTIVNGWPMCFRHEESVNHLMLNCKTTRFIWMSVVGWFEFCCALPNSLLELFQAWKAPIGDSRGKVMWRLSFLAVIWTIWKERNLRCFKGIASSESNVVEKLKFFVALWVSINASFRGYSLQQTMYHWKELAFSNARP